MIECYNKKLIWNKETWTANLVNCGKCLNCKKKRGREWFVRCIDELEKHPKKNSFITLTYNQRMYTNHRDKTGLTKFIKRLREKSFRRDGLRNIKYYAVSEQGEINERFHWHILLFGYRPEDLIPFKDRGTHILYVSEELSNLWGKGHVTLGEITAKSIRYVLDYLWKDPEATAFMSRGLGYADDKLLENEEPIKIGQSTYAQPRYYIRKYREKTGDSTFMKGLTSDQLSKIARTIGRLSKEQRMNRDEALKFLAEAQKKIKLSSKRKI